MNTRPLHDPGEDQFVYNAFDPTRLTQVRFRFDRTPAGAVVLDNIGFRTTE